MIHVYCSKQDAMIKEQAKLYAKKVIGQRDEFNYIALDMLQSTLEEAAYECEMLPLGYEKKAVVLENCAFLRKGAGGKGQSEEGIKAMETYLLHPNPDIELFFLVYDLELDKSSPLMKAILAQESDIQTVKSEGEQWTRFTGNYFAKRGSSIERSALDELLRRVDGDYSLFKNEANKLLTYAGGSPITLEMVTKLAVPYLEDDVFKMSNALSRNNVRAAMAVYQDLKGAGKVEEVQLLGLLASSFRFMDQVRYLDGLGQSADMISKTLGASYGRVKANLAGLYGTPSDAIPHILEQLYLASKRILTGECSGEYSFSLFLANFKL